MPIPAKIGLSLCLCFIIFPMVANENRMIAWNASIFGYFIKEVFIGYIMGFLIQLPFNIAQMTGIVIDNQRGSSSLTGQDPSTGTQVSTMGVLYNSLLIIIFFSLNGPFIFFDALVKSFQIIPLDQYPSYEFFTDTKNPFWIAITAVMGKAFMLATQMASPALLTILMTDAFLGIINRLAPQVQISFLGQGLKAFLGDLAVWFAWFFILEQLGKMGIKWTVGITDYLTGIWV